MSQKTEVPVEEKSLVLQPDENGPLLVETPHTDISIVDMLPLQQSASFSNDATESRSLPTARDLEDSVALARGGTLEDDVVVTGINAGNSTVNALS